MWAVINTTRYAADRTWIQDKDGNKHWLVLVKATYDLLPNEEVKLAKDQLALDRQPRYLGVPANSSMAAESDFFGVKSATDVIVNGSACVPGGKRAESIDLHFAVGPVRKHLRVFGARYWKRSLVGGLAISAPEPFDRMPIGYERAFGGWDKGGSDSARHRLDLRNPIGTGFLTHPDHASGTQLPNFERPDDLITTWKSRPSPAGSGPLECHWSPRMEFAGTYDEAWRKNRFPLWATNYDSRYNNSAPLDQQVSPFLRGGERAAFVNFTESGSLAFTLPRVHLAFETRFGTDSVEHRAQLSTVIVEPDERRLMLVWQTSLACNERVDQLDATVVREKPVI